MDYDVIIIGAGLSGLAAGIRLAHFGRRVCIVEKHGRIGGLNSYYSLEGRIVDVGLHAMTNYVPGPVKSSPLTRILRQLRLSYDDFQLCPQQISRISFPVKELQFTNDFHFMVQEIAEKFPNQIDGFLELTDSLHGYDDLPTGGESVSTRQVLKSFLSDPLLIEMLLCPVMFYGNPQENDMDFALFSILFRSIFKEGFARPQQGMQQILQLLVEKYRESGGELKTKCKVQNLHILKDQVAEVQLADGQMAGDQISNDQMSNNQMPDDQRPGGQRMRAKTIISSIGLPETRALCSQWDTPFDTMDTTKGLPTSSAQEPRPGELSFVESILITDVLPAQSLGFENTILFYNDTDHFDYRKPDGLVNFSSGVVCCPNNYQAREPVSGKPVSGKPVSGKPVSGKPVSGESISRKPISGKSLSEGIIRLTHIANFDLWNGLDKDTYRIRKKHHLQESVQKAERFTPGISQHILARDMFTPETIRRFTGRMNGAVYGSAHKVTDGRTPIKNLFICGTDQGWVGIIGALLSGITIANKYVLY
jgi:phytoene dehydrogenase-like protein